MSRLLMEMIPGYLHWATTAREQARNQCNLCERDQMEPLNNAASAALESCHHRLDQLVTSHNNLNEKMITTMEEIKI